MTLRNRSASPRIAVFTDKIDWHVEKTLRAFAQLGARAIPVRLGACKFDTRRPGGLAIPGFHQLPDAAVVRAIGDGTLEMITMRLGVLHALEALGVPVANSARCIERCTDKSMATFLVAKAGAPTPETFVAQTTAQAMDIARRECPKGPLVAKPLFGAQGWGLRLIRRPENMPTQEEIRGVFYLQRFVPRRGPQYEDTRILISGGEPIGAMRRRSNHWITNVRQGAKPFAVAPTPRETELAMTAARALGADCAGVDLIEGDDGPLVLEVNSMPGWFGLQKVVEFDIAQRLAEDVLKQV